MGVFDVARPKATHVLSQLADLEQQLKSAETNQGRDDGATEGSLPSMRTPRANAPKVPNLKLDALREPHPPSNLPPGASSGRKGRGLFRKYEYSSAPGTLERGESAYDLPSAEGTHGNSLPFVTSARSDESLLPAVCSGLDRDTLLKIGVPTAILSRVSKLLSAYVTGFNGLVRDIVAVQPEGEQPALIAVIWQSLLGVVEDNFQVNYSSKLGSIAQMWLEQHSTLQEELSGVSQNLDSVYSQNVLLQETIVQTRNLLEQEKSAKQYSLRLREHADRMMAKSRKEMAQQQAQVEQMKLVVDDHMMLPGKVADLQRQLLQLKKREAKFEENAVALEAAKNKNMQLLKELEDAKLQVFAAQQAQESNEKYTARLDEHMNDVQHQMRTYHQTIKAKEKDVEDMHTLLRSTQQLLKVSEEDREAMTSKYETEMKNHQTLSREHERVASELEHITVSLMKLKEDHQALGKQKEEQVQKLEKQLAKEQEAGARQNEALKSRLGTAMGDKAVVVMKLQSELTNMAKWKDEQKEKTEAALRKIKQMEEDFELERNGFADKERSIRKKFETQKREFAAEQLAEIERLHLEMDSVAEQHKQELAKREEARKREANAHIHQISSLKKDIKTAASKEQNLLVKVERLETALKGTVEELQAHKDLMEAKELEFQTGLSNARHAEAEAKTAVEIAKMDIASLKEAVEKKSDDIVSLQEMLEETTADAQQAKKALKKNELQIAEAKKLIASTVEQKALMSERVTVLMAEKSAVERSLQSSTRQVATLQQEVQKLQDNVNRLRENGEAKIKELKDTLEVAKRMTKLKQAAAASSSLQEATSGLEQQKAGLEEEKAGLETQLADMTEQMESYRDQLDDALEREADLRKEMEAQEDLVDELHSKLLDAQIEATHLQGNVEELEIQKQQMATARKSSRRGATQSTSDGSQADGSVLGGSQDVAGASELGDTQENITLSQLESDAAQGNSEGISKSSILKKIHGGGDGSEGDGLRSNVVSDEGPSEAVGGEGPTVGHREGDAIRKERSGLNAEGENSEVIYDEAAQKANHYMSRAAFFWANSEKEASQVRAAGSVQMKPKPSAYPPRKSPRSEMAGGDYSSGGQAAASDEPQLRLEVLYE